jgi:hypothetical protein
MRIYWLFMTSSSIKEEEDQKFLEREARVEAEKSFTLYSAVMDCISVHNIAYDTAYQTLQEVCIFLEHRLQKDWSCTNTEIKDMKDAASKFAEERKK